MAHYRHLVKADCEQLLNRLQQTESVRFEAFTQIWRDSKFEQIFYGAANRDNRVFTRLLLDTAYDFLLPPFSFQIRVGGLYLLYSLFHCQTTRPPEKIRVALKDWDEIQTFVQDSLDAHHYDIVYIFKKLLHMKVFVFTAMPRLLSFKKKRKPQQQPVSEGFMERPSAPQSLINNSLLEELSNVHCLYESLKTSVRPESESGLSLTRPDLVETLKGTVLGFYRWQRDKDHRSHLNNFVGSESGREDDGGEGPSPSSCSSQIESSRRADLLSSIKSRAYGRAAKVSKSRRHREVEVDHETKDAPASVTSTRYEKIRQKSLRYRASKYPVVTGRVWADVLSETKLTHLSVKDDEKPPRSFKRFKWKTEAD